MSGNAEKSNDTYIEEQKNPNEKKEDIIKGGTNKNLTSTINSKTDDLESIIRKLLKRNDLKITESTPHREYGTQYSNNGYNHNYYIYEYTIALETNQIICKIMRVTVDCRWENYYVIIDKQKYVVSEMVYKNVREKKREIDKAKARAEKKEVEGPIISYLSKFIK